MQMAPARTISSEQTLARIGRRMKTSESTLLALRARAGSGRAERHRGAVGDLLQAGDDQLLAGLQPRLQDVVVADDGADVDRSLPGHGLPALGHGDVGEVLAVDAVHR